MLFRFSSSYFSSIYYGLVSPPYYHCYMCHTQTWAHYIDQLVTLYLMRTITMLNCFKLLLHGIIERFEFFFMKILENKTAFFALSVYAHIHRKSFVFYVQNVAHARLNVSSALPLKWIKKRTIPQYHNQAFYYASVSRILENWIRSWFDYEIHAYFFTSKRLHMVVKSLCLFIFFVRAFIYINHVSHEKIPENYTWS